MKLGVVWNNHIINDCSKGAKIFCSTRHGTDPHQAILISSSHAVGWLCMFQVTPGGVRAVSCDGGMLEGSWLPDQNTDAAGGNTLSVASGNATQVVVASGGGNIHVLSVGQSGVSHVASHNLGSEIACVDITPTGETLAASNVVVWCTDDVENELAKSAACTMHQIAQFFSERMFRLTCPARMHALT